MTNTEKALNLLGMAYRARKLITGEDAVIRALQSKSKVYIVFVASDASSNTLDKFEKKCFFYKTAFETKFTTDEISKAIGKGLAKIVAVTDQGFYDSFRKLLSEV